MFTQNLFTQNSLFIIFAFLLTIGGILIWWGKIFDISTSNRILYTAIVVFISSLVLFSIRLSECREKQNYDECKLFKDPIFTTEFIFGITSMVVFYMFITN